MLLEFGNLEILYLHGNSITNLREVDKLSALTKLRKLSLHGNEIDKEKVGTELEHVMTWHNQFFINEGNQ